MNVQQRVDNGIQLLNEKLGPDWHKKINVSDLNIMANHRCIVGQLFGSYCDGIRQLGVGCSVAEQVSYGFEIYRGLSNLQVDNVELAEEWTQRILELRETAST